jgi:hypothetical protein
LQFIDQSGDDKEDQKREEGDDRYEAYQYRQDSGQFFALQEIDDWRQYVGEANADDEGNEYREVAEQQIKE